jgi:biopolymer transport protein ExbB
MKFTLLEWIIKGGWLMAPISLCSVLTVALFFERLFSLRISKIIPEKFLIEAEDLIKRKEFNTAKTLCKTNNSSIANIILVILENISNEKDVLKEKIEEAGKREAIRLSKYIGLLQAITAIAPLLGFLGTVFGMIQVFMQMEMEGSANIKFLAGGIYVALITTAAGLLVAIPTFIIMKYFEGRIDRLVNNLEEQAINFMEITTHGI